MSLNERDVGNSADTSAGSDRIQFTVIRFDSVQNPTPGDPTIPCAVWFKVVGLRVRHRVGLQEGAEIGDHGPATRGINSNHSVFRTGQAMRASSASQDRIQLAPDE